MLVQYYDNRLIVVGKLWCGHEGSHTYSIRKADAESLCNQFDDKEFIAQWCKRHASDFETITDFQLEIFDQTKQFDDEDSWLVVNEPYFAIQELIYGDCTKAELTA